MLGAIIGDIVGSRWEFNPTNDFNFELFSDKNSFTDDTICTIAVADAILKGRDYGESIHEWCRKYPNPMGGYGGNFAEWVRSSDPKPYGSFGNGAAMRVAPIGMFFRDSSDVIRHAEMAAGCTHDHPAGLNGAKAIAYATWCAVDSGDGLPEEAFLDEEIERICAACTCDFDIDFPIDLEDYRNKFDETCQGTLPAAFQIILESNSFEEAIRMAVSLGADADTLGAIVGSVAEHLWGIPEWMKDAAMSYLPQEMQDVVTRFYKECEKQEDYKPKTRMVREQEAMMLWKLGLGNMNRLMVGQNPNPDKGIPATRDSWKNESMDVQESEDISDLDMEFHLTDDELAVLRLGHIPESQEDHWFMYCDDEFIRYYRSWTGLCSFEAHYVRKDGEYLIDHLRVSHGLSEFGVNGNSPAAYLFFYLIRSEIHGHSSYAWDRYISKWEEYA